MWCNLLSRPMKMMEKIIFSTSLITAFSQDDDHQKDNDEEGGHRQDEKLIV